MSWRMSFLVALVVSLAVPIGLPLQAQANPAVAEALDEAFATLQDSDNRRLAKNAERRIIRLWLQSGSDTVDLLMTWALRAIDEQDHGLALDYLDRIVAMKPDYAEGWNKRATVHFLRDDYSKAVADIYQVLQLEPRHFGALSGLGMILRSTGEKERAIEVFEAALAVDPLLDNVREAIEDLRAETAGTEL